MTNTAVMIHGAFCGAWCLADFAGNFNRRGWRCIVPDLPKHGEGTGEDELARLSLADYRRAMIDLVGSLDTPPVIVGHSMGGLIAQQVAATVPVRGLVLLAPASPWGVAPTSEHEIAAAKGLLTAGAFWERGLSPVFEIAAGNSLDRIPAHRQRELFDRFGPESGQALFESMLWPLDLARASALDPEAVRCPTLWFAGADDKVTAAATIQASADRYERDIQVKVLPGHSHFLIAEPGWERIADQAERWAAALP
ncbi:alpha/beta hydrolase [Oceanibacterium hippocampi]|uniref:Alpha/beta hydrolase family protein n=1 Tax=Oceanibacterium hippocampi TaxID=745714 RepID=A0A1Y5RBJ4_9PROT|nr:alpha/beta hydrolase [Oceanibacterium hippocampi]SLN13518.1 Alpha/beta hydrolase family protein [Oceanibacterium hippocampi]